MEKRRRIAVFGGSFDPVHSGHAALVREVLAQRLADEVLIVPSFAQPLKPQGAHASFADRTAMLEIAFAGMPHVKVSRIEEELHRTPVYTIDMMAALRRQYPAGRLLLMIGEDSLYDLPRWHEGRRLAEEYDWIVFPRRMTRLPKVPPMNFCPNRKKDTIDKSNKAGFRMDREKDGIRNFELATRSGNGRKSANSGLSRDAERQFETFGSRVKKDRTGSLRRLPALSGRSLAKTEAVTAENAPIRDFCETKKGAAGILAAASRMPEPKPSLPPSWPEELVKKLQCSVLDLPFWEISSTELRKKLEKNENTANLLPDGVRAYICARGLYRGAGSDHRS